MGIENSIQHHVKESPSRFSTPGGACWLPRGDAGSPLAGDVRQSHQTALRLRPGQAERKL